MVNIDLAQNVAILALSLIQTTTTTRPGSGRAIGG